MKKFRGIYIKNDAEVRTMQEAGQIVAEILQHLRDAVQPGIPTMFFEEMALDLCAKHQVKPAFKGYLGYPFALCCSVNEQVVHGFPSDRVLEQGDIVSFDMGVVHKGFYGDSAVTVAVGEISEEAQKLLKVTEESLFKGIEQALPEGDLYDISLAIQKHVESHGYSVVRRFVGHGIGRHLHEKPEVPNFVPKGASSVVLKPGMVLAIEPMVCVGGPEVEIMPDKWTAVTKDRSLSAHFEHSVVVTARGPQILSLRPQA